MASDATKKLSGEWGLEQEYRPHPPAAFYVNKSMTDPIIRLPQSESSSFVMPDHNCLPTSQSQPVKLFLCAAGFGYSPLKLMEPKIA